MLGDSLGAFEGNVVGYSLGVLDGDPLGVLDGVAVGPRVGAGDGGKNCCIQADLYGIFQLSFETAGCLFRIGAFSRENNCRSTAPLIALEDLFLYSDFVVVVP